jgi:hypothetical protein
METLALAAKPSTERLHLRNLFSDGRRYYFKLRKSGFQLNSASRTPWRRRRGRMASVLLGTCSLVSAEVTRVDLRSHMTLVFFLDVFLLPGWMSLLLLFGPLPRSTGILASVIVLSLSWIWHWYNAMLQVTDMIYFVEVALDDLPQARIEQLSASSGNTINADFESEWQRFYEEHRGA